MILVGAQYVWSGYKITKGIVRNDTVLKLILASISLNKYDTCSNTLKSLLYIDVELCQNRFQIKLLNIYRKITKNTVRKMMGKLYFDKGK